MQNGWGGVAGKWNVSQAITSVSVWPKFREPLPKVVAVTFKPLHAAIASPVLLLLVALSAMLFRPPDLKTFPLDRIAFLALIAVFALRICLRRERLHTYPATWPMLALMLLAVLGALGEMDAPQAWSLVAAKWIVPFTLFHIAGSVFHDQASFRKLEIFSLVVLFYLALVSVFCLFDAKFLIFPRFILDEGLGIHADRARGPLLQAVANGVCLSILGLIAVDSFRRKVIRGILSPLLFMLVPLALLATKTRAVWLAAAFAVCYLVVFGTHRRVRGPALALCVVAAVAFCGAWVYDADAGALKDRLQDRSPVDFRLEIYQAGWQMFAEKPLTGWGNEVNIQPEIARRISDFHPELYLFHNTYLELAVERGILLLG